MSKARANIYQLDLFSSMGLDLNGNLIEENEDECNFDDKVINQLCNDIKTNFDKVKNYFPKVNYKKVTYEVWKHVKHLGKRLDYVICFIDNTPFYNDGIHELGLGKNRAIELLKYVDIFDKYDRLGIQVSVSVSPWDLSFSTIEKKYTKNERKKDNEQKAI